MKVKLLTETAKLPTRGSTYAAGFDLYSDEDTIIPAGTRKLVSTGIAVAVPIGYYGRVAPRSGLANKHGIDVFAGVIDADYRGEVGVILYNAGYHDFTIKKSDRIAQLVLESIFTGECRLVDNLDGTERNADGFGSTGL